VECLLQDQNLPILSDILLYHVASGEVLSTDLRNGMQIPTLLQEEELIVYLRNGVQINDAFVVVTDVLALNGVIHVINQVLVPPLIDVGAFLQTCRNGHGNGGSHSMMPPPSRHNNNNGGCIFLGMHRSVGQYLVGPTHTCLCTYGIGWTQCRPNHQDDASSSLVDDIPTTTVTTAYDWDDHQDASLVDIPTTSSSSLVDIPTTAIQASIFSTLVAALSATDLVGAISEPRGPFTVFAPTDDAFNALPDGLVNCLLEEKNLPILTDILLYHVASGRALSIDLPNRQQILTLLEDALVTVDLNNGVKINDSNVITADVRASNGVIHIIDQVLVPPRIDVGAFLQTCGRSNGSNGIRGSSSHQSSVQQQQSPYGHYNNNYNNNHNDSTCIYLGMQLSVGQYLVGPTYTCLCTHGGAWTQCRLNQHW